MKFKYLFFIILSCLVVGYVVFSWSEPITPMPSRYTAPLNTSATAQNKVGELGAASFVDADDSDYYINPSGNSVVSGKIVMENSTSSTDIPTTIATKGYVDTEIARVESLVNGSLPLVYNMHTREACTTAGGTVVDSDVSLPMCRFNAAACPANWTQYKNFSTTVGKTCQIGYTMGSGTYNCPAVITGDHAWSNVPHESKPTYELNATGICGSAHSSYGGPWCYSLNNTSISLNCYSCGTCPPCSATVTQIGCY